MGGVILLLLSGFWFQVAAATLPSGFVESTYASGLSSPTAMDFAPDGRLFVCLQGGNLRVIKNGALLPAPFVSLTVDSAYERGLLGIAFDPNFATNNFLYVYYTVPGSVAHNRVSRLTANGDVAVANSETVILDLDNLSNAGNHNGGAIHFGPDGKLYIAVGENANRSNSQTLTNLLGKVLRINADGTIPTDNPFLTMTTGKNQAIWALGLRNPFTFAFQAGTTRMFINDVGEGTWEEINDGIAGSNYGWPTTEGPTTDPRFRSPLFAYQHNSGAITGCAITGGSFYNPTTAQFPAAYTGKYFFADFCSGWIKVLDPSNNTAADFATGINGPVDLKVGPDGSLYYVAINAGSIFKVQYSPASPAITTHPANQTVSQGATATFTVAASGTAPLSYQWQRNMVNISGANSSSYTTSPTVPTDNGAKFRCVVSNGSGNATSNEATLTVNVPPSITGHPSDKTVLVGQPVTFSVTAAGDPTLNYQWQRNMSNISGANSSSFTISTTTLADSGAKFRCVVSNGFGSANSNEATLTVLPPVPVLQADENTDHGISFDSLTMLRDPYPLTNVLNLSQDKRTRVMLFAANLDLLSGENSSAVTARAEDAQMMLHPLTVEFVGKVPGLALLTEIIVVLPADLPTGQEVLVSVIYRTQTSNKVRIKIK